MREKKVKEKENFSSDEICVWPHFPDTYCLFSLIMQSIAEMLRLNVAMAMRVAFGLLGSDYKTRDTSIDDLGRFEKVEVSVLLCNDDFIQKLNKEWRDEDKATDVLSMSQHIPELDLPIVSLWLETLLLPWSCFVVFSFCCYKVIHIPFMTSF